MREIKFRGKDILGKWRYGDLVQEKWKSLLNTNKKSFMIKKDKTAYTVLEETIGQFTGLKDKNGQEIYEGDIVFIKGDTELLDIKGKVEYNNSLAQFEITNTGDIINEEEPLGDYAREDLEVIGNIYDNPELLKK